MKTDEIDRGERRTIDLWPTAGRQLGLSRTPTYAAAVRGDIPGAFKLGGRWLVSREPFEEALRKGQMRSAA